MHTLAPCSGWFPSVPMYSDQRPTAPPKGPLGVTTLHNRGSLSQEDLPVLTFMHVAVVHLKTMSHVRVRVRVVANFNNVTRMHVREEKKQFPSMCGVCCSHLVMLGLGLATWHMWQRRATCKTSNPHGA